MAFHHTLFQLRELLIWLHLILQVQASKQTIWWQVHSPRNEWICMNLLGKFSLLAPVRGQKQISYFSSKCTGVNARCCQGPLQSREFITMYSCWYSFVHEEKSTSTSISGTTSSPTPKQNMLGRTLWLPAATVCCSKSCSSKCYRKRN